MSDDRAAELEAWTAANRRARAAIGDTRGRQMRPAHKLEDRHLGWNIRIGGVTGTLTGILPIPNDGGFELAVLVGGSRAWFRLTSDAGVEVWRA